MSIFDVIENPPLLHAIIVHFPVVLGVLGVPLVFLVALLDTERNVLRWLTAMAYALLVVCAFAAVESGKRAHARVPNTLPPEVYELIGQHEEIAEWVWVPAAATAILLVIGAIKIRWFRNTSTLLAMLASLACAAMVTFTGHYGGTLVHKHGLSGAVMLRADGTAPPPQETEKPQPPPEKPVEPTPPAPSTIQTPPPAEVPSPTPAPAVEPVSYVKSVQPIVQNRCAGCHGDTEPKGGLTLTSVAGMMKTGEHSGVGLVPGQPENSSIIKHIRAELEPRMPPGVLPLSEADIETLRRWIAEGAKDDSPSAPPSVEPVSYVKSVQPIFHARCAGCHGDTEPKGGITLTSVAGMMKTGEHSGVGVVPGQPENSSIIKHIRAELDPPMPPGTERLPAPDVETLTQWIAEGAKDDSPSLLPAQ